MLKQFYCLPVAAMVASIALPVNTARAEDSRVRCADAPERGVRECVYETLWEIPADTEEYLVGSIAGAAYDRQGNICSLDPLQKNLKIFSQEGNWLRTIGREGEGPGECSDARAALFDGDRYGLLQAFPAVIVWLNPDGSPSEKVFIGGQDPDGRSFLGASLALQCGPSMYAWLQEDRFGEGESGITAWISRIHADGGIGPVLYAGPDLPDAIRDDGLHEELAYDIVIGRWTCDGNGGLWVATERDRYLLQHWNGEGELDLEFERDYEPVVRGGLGRERVTAWYVKRGLPENQIHVGRTAPVVQSLRLSDDGHIWIKLDQGGIRTDSGEMLVYDVISQDGRYLEQIRIHCDSILDDQRLLDDWTALVLTSNSEDEPVVALQKIRTLSE